MNTHAALRGLGDQRLCSLLPTDSCLPLYLHHILLSVLRMRGPTSVWVCSICAWLRRLDSFLSCFFTFRRTPSQPVASYLPLVQTEASLFGSNGVCLPSSLFPQCRIYLSVCWASTERKSHLCFGAGLKPNYSDLKQLARARPIDRFGGGKSNAVFMREFRFHLRRNVVRMKQHPRPLWR